MLWQNWGSDKWRIHFLVKSYYELCLVGCLKKITVLIYKHFFRFFNEKLGADISSFGLLTLKASIFLWNIVWFLTSSIVLMAIYKSFIPFTGPISYKQISHRIRVSFERYLTVKLSAQYFYVKEIILFHIANV